jgi:aminoglycoside phosphotransferase (APT) family kinase protein
VPVWEAEREVDAPLVRRLLAQFPELRVDSLVPLAAGWDRSVWLLDERWVFGFPRRAVVVPGLEREVDVLPRLAPLLPLAVPEPVFVGQPTDEFPWPFTGSALLPGQELGDAELGEAEARAVAHDVAGFLRVLHGDDVASRVDGERLPRDANARADMQQRVPRTRDALAEVQRLGLWRVPTEIVALLDDAEKLGASPREHSVIHGDLHFRHVLVSRGRAAAVIDWIDVCRGDPCVDLQLLWSSVPPAQRGAFLETYGTVDDDQLVRARVVALFLCASLALYGEREGLESIRRAALAGLDNAASSDPVANPGT